ncbi:MAG: cupin domain-containing protein [Deltaproteobacteria bacterium]|nr:cupin domain-containing protein [Deltaproteobacteria bacterium]
MIIDIHELLPLYALGILDPEEARTVERALASDPTLVIELAALQRVAESLVVPIPPSDHVKARLLASIGGGPFERYAGRMASLFDVGVPRAHELLGLIERPSSWELPMPGVGLVHFEGGPACATADCGFVRLAPGTPFPPHTHRGEETTVILAGRLRDGARILVPGDELVQGPTTENHIVIAEGDEDCIYAARVFDGIEIGGVRAVPRR